MTGIWHGANWTFLVWGLVYGLLLILERVWLGAILKKNKIRFFNRLLTFLVVNFLWVVFRADNIMEAGLYLSRMFVGGIRILNLLTYLSGLSVITIICGALFGGFLQAHMSLLFLVNGTYNPFIYYQF